MTGQSFENLDDEYMKERFGKTSFGGIIMHGMNNFGDRLVRPLCNGSFAAATAREDRWRRAAGAGGRGHPVAVCDGAIPPGGRLPVNTNGGGLSFGHPACTVCSC